MAYKSGDNLYPTCPDTNKAAFEDIDYVDTWRAMEDLVDEGLCQAIGVSNFNEQQITRLLGVAKLKPVVLQIECHPYLSQKSLITLCYDNAIAVTAYSCLGSGHTPYEKPGAYPLLQHPTILAISEKYERTPAQVRILYYNISLNWIIISHYPPGAPPLSDTVGHHRYPAIREQAAHAGQLQANLGL